MTDPTTEDVQRTDRVAESQEARARLEAHTSACLMCDDNWHCFPARQLALDVQNAEQWLR